jgi:hypothetical protein
VPVAIVLTVFLCAYWYNDLRATIYEWWIPANYKASLHQADKKAETAIQEQLAVVDEFFQRARQRTTQYADHVLGLGGKIEYALRGEDQFLHFARCTFDEIIFSQDQLQDLLTSLIDKYAQQVNDIDNELLISIRLDTDAEHPGTPNKVELPEVTLPESMPRTMVQSIAQDIASIIVGDLVADIALRAAASAGLIRVSSIGGLQGFIVGIFGSILADGLMESIYGTKAKLSYEVDRKLQAMHQQVRSKLEKALKKYHKERKVTRRRMIVSMSR